MLQIDRSIVLIVALLASGQIVHAHEATPSVDAKTTATETAPTAETSALDTKSDTPTEQVMKVVYHADFADPRRFSSMLTSINNMVTVYQNDLKEYDVRIVFVSHGVRFVTTNPLKGTPFAEDAVLKARRKDLIERLRSLHDTQGVKLELCGITREQVHLAPENIIEGVEIVPSGVVRLAELQHQGFAYIKIE